ncbi:MAG TPA: response regulator [Smithellaceae bacterium]|jgi:CheY-like chemotaxis protein|nr:response regulator [Smithellaceae bacterium]
MNPKILKVLVIDDEEHFCRALKKGFSLLTTFQVQTTTQAEDGLQLAKAMKPDIILLDIMMPGMSGPELAEELAEDPATASIPIIFVTAIVKPGEVRGSAGMTGKRLFIAKPVKMDDLIKKINQVVTKAEPS